MSVPGGPSSPLRWLLPVAGVVVTLAAVIVWAPWKREPASPSAGLSPDPRLTYAGPYQNIDPDVKYVGDAACAACHQQVCDSFHRHPMGRSIVSVAEANQRALESPEHNNPFIALGVDLRIDREGDRVWQREVRRDVSGQPIYTNSFEVQYVVGSGSHGHSYLTDRGGYVFQAPISWYSSKKQWLLAPGWEVIGAGRPILSDCLFCHANRVEPVPGSLNRYREPLFGAQVAIGCERCHGPGEKHIATAGAEFTIVNPAKLEPSLRESVCQQCHLEGEDRHPRRGRELFDFRPGLPLGAFLAIAVRAEGKNPNAVNHVEQMDESGCYKGGAGKSDQIGCISCHDPHVKPTPEDRVAHYRNSCLKCHAQRGCNVPEAKRREASPQDSCIQCHMPAMLTADIPHTASANHRIPRRPPGSPPRPEAGLPLRSFYPLAGREEDRELGIALAEAAMKNPSEGRYARDALTKLESALAADPADADAWEAKANALAVISRQREAATAFVEVLRLQPDRESAVSKAASLAMRMNRQDEAERLWRHALELNPWIEDYHANLAQILAARGDWAGARDHADGWLKLDPGSLDARKLLVEALLETGDKVRARNEFAKIEALKPKDLLELRAKFGGRLK